MYIRKQKRCFKEDDRGRHKNGMTRSKDDLVSKYYYSSRITIYMCDCSSLMRSAACTGNKKQADDYMHYYLRFQR
jgi:hypothetical protein